MSQSFEQLFRKDWCLVYEYEGVLLMLFITVHEIQVVVPFTDLIYIYLYIYIYIYLGYSISNIFIGSSDSFFYG